MTEFRRVTEQVFEDLGEKIWRAMKEYIDRGMRVEDASCVVVSIAADFLRGSCARDDKQEKHLLSLLAEIVIKCQDHPVPDWKWGEWESRRIN